MERDLKVLMDKFEMIRKFDGLMAAKDVGSYTEARIWLKNEACSPWNLCDLTKEQSQLTLRKWRPDRKKKIPREADAEMVDPFEVPAETSWINPSFIEIQDPVSGILIELPQIDVSPSDAVNGTIPDDINISDAFPLTPDQKLADHRYDPLAQARLLQPAQLRMGLLLDRDLATDLLQRLDGPTRQQSPTEDPEKSEPIITEPTDDLPPNTVEPETPIDPLPEPDPK